MAYTKHSVNGTASDNGNGITQETGGRTEHQNTRTPEQKRIVHRKRKPEHFVNRKEVSSYQFRDHGGCL